MYIICFLVVPVLVLGLTLPMFIVAAKSDYEEDYLKKLEDKAENDGENP